MCLVCFINAEEARAKLGVTLNSSSADSNFYEDCTDDDGDLSISIEQGVHALHYFAIGSMTNRISIALRELAPISSRPAVLRGYRILFRGSGGMASAERDGEYELLDNDAIDYPFDGIHGVLHLLSEAHMKVLDDFEGGYKRKVCTVHLYDGRQVHAFVYQMNATEWAADQKHELPTERYLDIIAKGCEYHGADPAWVRFLRSHNCVRRKVPSEFTAFHMDALHIPIISWPEVRRNDGRNGAKLWIVINNKVLEFMGDVTSFFPFGYFVKNGIGGTDFTIKFAKGFYEPKYRLSNETTSSSELENEHRAWIEDQFANPPPVLASSRWRLVGVVTSELERSAHLQQQMGQRRVKHCHAKPRISFKPHMSEGFNYFFVQGSLESESTVPVLDGAIELLPIAESTTAVESGVLPPIPSDSSLEDMQQADSTGDFATLEAQQREQDGRGISQLLPAKEHSNSEIHPPTPTVEGSRADHSSSNSTAGIYTGVGGVDVRGGRGQPTSGLRRALKPLWIFADGTFPGQTLHLRKTGNQNYQTSVTLRINHQDLSSPNLRSNAYILATDTYYVSFCWDGECWFLEHESKSSSSSSGGAHTR